MMYKTADVMIEILVNIASSFIAVDFMRRSFKSKYEGKKRYWLFFLACVSYFAAVSVMNIVTSFEGLAGLIYAFVLLLYAQIALRGAFVEKAVVSIIWDFIALVSTFFVLTFMRFITGHEFDTLIVARNYIRIYTVLAGLILKFVLTRGVLFVRDKKHILLDEKEEKNVIGIFIVLFIMVITFMTLELQEYNEQLRHYLVLLLLFGFSAILCWVYYFYHRLSLNNQEKMQMQYIRSSFSKQEEYMESLTKSINELRILRHDIKAQYSYIYTLMKSGQNEEAMASLETINRKLEDNAALEKLTKNDGMNAALIETIQDCKTKRINFYYVIDSSVEKIPGMDLGVMFYNLLNNAVEACQKVDGKREISLKVETYRNYMRCKLSNSICEPVLVGNPNLDTTKDDKDLHGYGLKSVRQIIEKYDGGYSVSEEDGVLTQVILLKFVEPC